MTSELGFDFIPEEELIKEQKPEEGFVEEQIGRRAQRYGTRAAETLGGLPGDIIGLVRSIKESTVGITPREKLSPFQQAGRDFLEAIPTSDDIRAVSAEYEPQLQPKNKFEEVEDEVVSDFASLAIPVKGKVPFARALGLSFIGNAGKEVVDAFGGGDTAQEATKLGMMVFSGMFGKGRGINKHISNIYNKAREAVPVGQKFAYSGKNLANLESRLLKGTVNEAKAPVLQIIEDIKTKSGSKLGSTGLMSVDDAVEFDKNINHAIKKSTDSAKTGWLKQLKKSHASEMETYAKENPTWGETFKEAKQAYQGIAQSERIQSYIKKNLSLRDFGHAALALGMEEHFFPGKTAGTVAAGAALSGAAYMGEVARRITKNPALRKYYANVLNASLNENKAMLVRNMKGLNSTMKKDIEKDPLETFNFSKES